MSKQSNKTERRWTVVVGAVMIQLCLGAIYAWSLFNQPLVEKFGWAREEVVLTFSLTIGMFALSSVFAGRMQDKVGPRKVAMAGALLLGSGVCLTSIATELWQLYLFYGIIGGTGVGTTYVTPLATCVKWYPDKRGAISGIAIVGMGLGGMLFKPVITHFLDTVGVSQAFLYLGAIYFTFILIGALFLKLPPEDYQPEGWTPPAGQGANVKHATVGEMVRTKQFYLLWALYLIGCTAGLMVISIAKDIGVDYARLSPADAANIVVSIAIANASGRLFWGAASDKVGRPKVLSAKYLITMGALLFLAFGPMSTVSFYASASLLGFCFGGFLAIFPTVVADFYGTKHLGINYGVLYLAYGAAAFIGPFLNSSMSLQQTFMVAAGMALIAFIGTLFIRHPFSKA